MPSLLELVGSLNGQAQNNLNGIISGAVSGEAQGLGLGSGGIETEADMETGTEESGGFQEDLEWVDGLHTKYMTYGKTDGMGRCVTVYI